MDNEAVHLTGPGKIQYLKSVHVSHCSGSFIPGTDSSFFQALFLAVQLSDFLTHQC